MKQASEVYADAQKRKDTQIKIRAAKRKRAALLHQRKNKKNILKWILIGVGGLVIIGALVFAFVYKPGAKQISAFLENGTFAEGVVVEGVDISGLSYSQAMTALSEVCETKLENTEITFEFNDSPYILLASELGITTDVEDVLQTAILADKTDSFFANIKTKTTLKHEGDTYSIGLVINNVALTEAIALLAEDLYSAPAEPAMVFDAEAQDGEYIYWEEGQDGVAISEEELINLILENVPLGEYDLGTIETIITSPENTAEALSEEVVKISEYTTSFYGVTLSEEKRVQNVLKMADLVNGSVIEPGETWSFNDCSGERTEDGGWQLAKTLYGGVLVEEMGGGVCQVSSTVYNAFLLAEVGIVERHAHSKPSSYVPTGLDATVDYGVKDLKINNTLDDTIYLVVQVNEDEKTITASVYGPKPDHDYQVIVRALIWQSDIQPEEGVEIVVAEDGYAPDGTYVAPGTSYAYPKTTTGSRYKTYRYYYPLDFDDDTDDPYSWIGYEKGDNSSGEKISVQYYTEDGDGKDIVTYYPPIAGTTYINPADAG